MRQVSCHDLWDKLLICFCDCCAAQTLWNDRIRLSADWQLMSLCSCQHIQCANAASLGAPGGGLPRPLPPRPAPPLPLLPGHHHAETRPAHCDLPPQIPRGHLTHSSARAIISQTLSGLPRNSHPKLQATWGQYFDVLLKMPMSFKKGLQSNWGVYLWSHLCSWDTWHPEAYLHLHRSVGDAGVGDRVGQPEH